MKKKTSFNEYEDDYVKRVMSLKNETKLHDLREMEQEKIFLERINDYLENNDTINHEVFESFSHELRTPIVTIKAYIDMILMGKFGTVPSELKPKLSQVSENTELLIDVVMKILEKIKEKK